MIKISNAKKAFFMTPVSTFWNLSAARWFIKLLAKMQKGSSSSDRVAVCSLKLRDVILMTKIFESIFEYI